MGAPGPPAVIGDSPMNGQNNPSEHGIITILLSLLLSYIIYIYHYIYNYILSSLYNLLYHSNSSEHAMTKMIEITISRRGLDHFI